MVRQRHARGIGSGSGIAVRSTHVSSGVNFAAPSVPLYGSQMDTEPVTVQDIGQGSVTDGAIVFGGLNGSTALAAGTLDITPFASSIRPVAIVAVLPTLPDALYPLDSYVVLSTTHRLYKNVGGAWVLGVDGADIVTDSITAGQIAAGAISTSELSAGAVTTSKLNVTDGFGINLVPNGSFQRDLVLGPYTSGPGTYVRAAEGISDTFCAELQAVGPSVTYRRSTAEFPLIPGSTISASLSTRNFSAGSPTSQAWVLARKVGTASGSFDYAYLIYSAIVADGGPFVRYTLAGQVIASDAVAAVVGFGMVTNAGVGAGYTSQVRYEDIQVEYGGAATAYRPSTMGGNVVIDSSGIEVNNGNVIIRDQYGALAMNGAGFGESWEDFLSTGLYNGAFLRSVAGSPGSSDYWTITGVGAYQALSVVAEANAPGGFKIRYSATATHSSANYARLFSGFSPVTGPAWYVLSSYWNATTAGAGVSVNAAINWYTAGLVYISSTALLFTGIATGWSVVINAVSAPINARFAAVSFDIFNPATATVDVDVRLVNLTHYSTTQGFIPPGTIVLWSGTNADVPSGWKVCDGNNGTPDLTDRFLVGNSGSTTGSGGTVSPTSALAHSSHTHTMANTGSASGSNIGASGTTQSVIGTHAHTTPDTDATTVAAHSAFKYYKLAYIMKL